MKTILFTLISVFVTLNSISQTEDQNIQKGYAAEGYDVVSYFENLAKEGKKEFKTTYEGADYKFSSKKKFKHIFE